MGSCLVVSSIGKKALLDMKIPVLPLALSRQSIAESLVVPFDQTVRLEIVQGRKVMLDILLL